MQAKLLFDCDGPDPDSPGQSVIVPEGTILEGPDCWRHCVPDFEGVTRAEPADEECVERLAQYHERLKVSQERHKRLRDAKRKASRRK